MIAELTSITSDRLDDDAHLGAARVQAPPSAQHPVGFQVVLQSDGALKLPHRPCLTNHGRPQAREPSSQQGTSRQSRP